MLDFKLLLILYHQVVIILVSELDFAISGLRESLVVLVDEAGYVVNAVSQALLALLVDDCFALVNERVG